MILLINHTLDEAFLFKSVDIFGGGNRTHTKQRSKRSYRYLFVLRQKLQYFPLVLRYLHMFLFHNHFLFHFLAMISFPGRGSSQTKRDLPIHAQEILLFLYLTA